MWVMIQSGLHRNMQSLYGNGTDITQATIFRGSGWSFANDPDFMHVSSSANYWDQANEKFYEKYKGLDNKHKEWASLVVSGSPIIGPTGRFWKIPMGQDWKGQTKIPWTVLSNYPVQGTAADLMTIARVSFLGRLKKLNLDGVVKLVSSVHDSIVVDAPSALLQEITNLFHQVFDDLAKNVKKLFGYEWEVPLGCEVKYGPNMKDMTKNQRNDLVIQQDIPHSDTETCYNICIAFKQVKCFS